MRPKLAFMTWGLAFVCLFSGVTFARAAQPKFEAQLVWGTNDKASPNPKHKPVEEAVKERLSQLPLKFTNYFEVNRKTFSLAASGSSEVALSSKCGIKVSQQAGDTIEVSLMGKGEQVAKRTQPLPKGEILVLGGNAPNQTAWLVILKRVE